MVVRRFRVDVVEAKPGQFHRVGWRSVECFRGMALSAENAQRFLVMFVVAKTCSASLAVRRHEKTPGGILGRARC